MATTTAPLLVDLEALCPGPRLADASDETLAHLVAQANEPAFVALYERHHQALYRYCRSIVRNDTDAQDALQSAWTRGLIALRRGQRDAPVRPWLYRIVHNEAISLLRRRGRQAEEPAGPNDPVPSAEDHALDRERFASLLADLRELPERPRGALLMRELSGLSHEEIAVALDTSVSAAKQSIYEARRDLCELAAGRATPCDDICRRISAGDRRVLRGRRVSAHLRDCPSCAAFASTIDRRTAGLSALVPWLPAAAATAVLRGALRGWGASAAGTSAAGTSAGAGIAGTTGAAGGTGATVTPAAVSAGVVTKAVGVPLLGKALVAVAAVTAGVASVAGMGGGSHVVSRSAPAHLAPRPVPSLAHAAALSVARHRTGARSSAAAAAASAGAPKHSSAAARGHSASVSAHDSGRHVAAGHSSAIAPGQAKKVTGMAPGHVGKVATVAPGQAKQATTTTARGQAKKATSTTARGQAKTATTTTARGQAKRATTPTTPVQANKTATTVAPGQAKKATTEPASSSTHGNSAAADAQ